MEIEILIPENTIGLNRAGRPLTFITIIEDTSPPPPPPESAIVGKVFDFIPAGSSFNPPVSVTYTYDKDDLPPGINEGNLVFALWDAGDNRWTIQDGCIVDKGNHTVTMYLSKFSKYAVLVFTNPAEFEVGNLTVTPVEAEPGGEVEISFSVSNIGGVSGTYESVLNINDKETERSDINVAAGDTQVVTFKLPVEESGRFFIEVSGLRGQFYVRTPASFEIGDLRVSPAEVVQGEEVQVSLIISNRGESTGTHSIVLYLNDEIISSRDVTLDGGSSQRVSFTAIAEQTGTCSFSVADNEFRIEVMEPALPEGSDTEGPVAGLPLEDGRESPAGGEADSGNGNWRLWAIFSGMAIIVIVLLILLIRVSKQP